VSGEESTKVFIGKTYLYENGVLSYFDVLTHQASFCLTNSHVVPGRSMEAILVSRKEAARALSVGRGKLDQLLSDGKIRARRIGRRVLIPRAELERFARGEQSARGSEVWER
jgi:excisionase family DNA binding protein